MRFKGVTSGKNDQLWAIDGKTVFLRVDYFKGDIKKILGAR